MCSAKPRTALRPHWTRLARDGSWGVGGLNISDIRPDAKPPRVVDHDRLAQPGARASGGRDTNLPIIASVIPRTPNCRKSSITSEAAWLPRSKRRGHRVRGRLRQNEPFDPEIAPVAATAMRRVSTSWGEMPGNLARAQAALPRRSDPPLTELAPLSPRGRVRVTRPSQEIRLLRGW